MMSGEIVMPVGNDFTDLFGEWLPDPEDNNQGPRDESMLEPENRVRQDLPVKECKVVNVYEACLEGGEPEITRIKTTFVLLRDALGRDPAHFFVLPDVAYAMQLALSRSDFPSDRLLTTL